MSTSAKYSCSQPALYEVSRHILQSFSQNIQAFSVFKTKYNPGYLSALEAHLNNAESLADYKARLVQSEVNYTLLCHALSECTGLWQKLKRYIKSAYPSVEHKQLLEEAGFLFYKKTVARNWEAANALLIASKNFLSKHASILSAGQNMPEGFINTFVEAYTFFSKCLLTFQQSEKEIKTATIHKLNINNALFATITEICQDGQLLFKSQKDFRDQFVFNSVLLKITGPKKQQLHHSDDARTPESANNNVLTGNNQANQ